MGFDEALCSPAPFPQIDGATEDNGVVASEVAHLVHADQSGRDAVLVEHTRGTFCAISRVAPCLLAAVTRTVTSYSSMGRWPRGAVVAAISVRGLRMSLTAADIIKLARGTGVGWEDLKLNMNRGVDQADRREFLGQPRGLLDRGRRHFVSLDGDAQLDRDESEPALVADLYVADTFDCQPVERKITVPSKLLQRDGV